MERKILYILCAFFVIGSVFAATFPSSVGYVNDFAKILPNAVQLNQQIADYERNTTVEIAVVTIDSLPEDQNIYTYSVELFQQWKIGQKGEDNGILVLIVKNGTTGNRMKIELGYGIQGYITGAEAGRILDTALPYYEADDYGKTAETIIAGLQDQLASYVPGKAPQDYNAVISDLVLPNFPFFIFLIIIVISVASRNRCPYCMKGKLKCDGDMCVCLRCKRKFNKKKRYAPVIFGGGFGGGGGGGFGGFGGGGSGGGGAGR